MRSSEIEDLVTLQPSLSYYVMQCPASHIAIRRGTNVSSESEIFGLERVTSESKCQPLFGARSSLPEDVLIQSRLCRKTRPNQLQAGSLDE